MNIDVNMVVSLVSVLASALVVVYTRNISLQIKSNVDLLRKDIEKNHERLDKHSQRFDKHGKKFEDVYQKIEKSKDKMHEFDLHIASCPAKTKQMTEITKRFRNEC